MIFYVLVSVLALFAVALGATPMSGPRLEPDWVDEPEGCPECGEVGIDCDCGPDPDRLRDERDDR